MKEKESVTLPLGCGPGGPGPGSTPCTLLHPRFGSRFAGLFTVAGAVAGGVTATGGGTAEEAGNL